MLDQVSSDDDFSKYPLILTDSQPEYFLDQINKSLEDDLSP